MLGAGGPLNLLCTFEVACLLHEQPRKGWHLILMSDVVHTASHLARFEGPA